MSRQNPSTLRQIVMALFNATIMLLIILVVSGIILITKVQNFTTDTVTAATHAVGQDKVAQITHGIGDIKNMAGKVIGIQTKLENVCKGQLDKPILGELKAEIGSLRNTVANLNTNVQDLGKNATRAAIEGVSKALERWLGVEPQASPPAA